MKKINRINNSLMRRNLHKFISNKLAIIGLVIVTLLILASLFAPLITKHNPSFVDPSQRLEVPSSEHLLGTDNAGRDLFARILYGGRVSILVGLVSAVGASVIGVILGCIAGYFGRKTDSTIVYISEIFMSFPQIILVLILVGFTGRGLLNLIIIFALTGWTLSYRVVRSRILCLREEPFIESCRANGIGGMSIMFKHLLPNTIGVIVVTITLQTAGYVLAEAALSFLGLGVDPSIPTWGNIINAGKGLLYIQNYPVLWIAPGITISLFVLAINFFGDGLRDVYDPGQ